MKRNTVGALLTAVVLLVALGSTQNASAQTAGAYDVVQVPYGKVVKERPIGSVNERHTSKTKYTILGYKGVDQQWTRNTNVRTPVYASGVPGGVTTIVQQQPKPKPVKQVVYVQAAPVNPAATQYYVAPSP